MQENVFVHRKEGVERQSDDCDDDSDEGQHSLNNLRYKPLSTVNHTQNTPPGDSHVTLKHDGSKTREAGVKTNFAIALLKSSPGYTSKRECLLSESLKERKTILLDIPDRNNELVMSAYYTQRVLELYPIIGLYKELPGIALPPPVLLDLPKLNLSKKVKCITSHQQVVRQQLNDTDSSLTVL